MKKLFNLTLLVVFFTSSYGQILLDPSLPPSTLRTNDAISDRYTASGTDAYTITAAGTFNYTFLNGRAVSITFTNPNTGAATLDFDGLGVKDIEKWSGGSLVDVEAGDLIGTVRIRYDGTRWVVEGGLGSGGAAGWALSGTSTLTGNTDIVGTSRLRFGGFGAFLNGFEAYSDANIILSGGTSSTVKYTLNPGVSHTFDGSFILDDLSTGGANEILTVDATGGVSSGSFTSNALSVSVSDPARTVTGTDAIVQADNGRTIYFNSATPFDFTIDALTINTYTMFRNIGAGTVTFVDGSGVTSTGVTELLSGGVGLIEYIASTTPIISTDGKFVVQGDGITTAAQMIQYVGSTGTDVYRRTVDWTPSSGSGSSGNYDYNIFLTDAIPNSTCTVTIVVTGVGSSGVKSYSKEMKASFRKPGTSDMVQVGSTLDVYEHTNDLTTPTSSVSVNADNLRVTYNSGTGSPTLQWTIFITTKYSTY